MKRILFSGIAGAVIALAATQVFSIFEHRNNIAAPSTAAGHPQLKPLDVNPAWAIDGKPNFRATEFFKSSDGKTSSGIFECDASSFEWHYSHDEAIYILEGGVELEYLGKKFNLQAGDSAFFRAGTVARWKVPQHVRKTWTLYDAGKLARKFAPV